MAIHWYPGHMHKANKDMASVLPEIDLIIEMLDARLPHSSANPLLAKLGANLPRIKILSKSDLADPDVTALWQAHYEQSDSVKTLLTTLTQSDKAQTVASLCRKLVPNKDNATHNIVAMITGIPNVGKSTLINALAGKAIAKTGNEPAITKGQQRINLRNGIILLDTPGVLWPKIENEQSGFRLATTGALKDTAINHVEVAFYAAEYLLKHYPERLMARYDLATLADTDLGFLEQMGARRGCLRAGGQVDLEKVSTLLLNELRSGKLGGISFETPEMVTQEIAALQHKQQEKAAARKENRLERKARRNLLAPKR
jgi:ribosome biogenesis GTPase A